MPHINPRRKRRICVGLDCTYTHCLTSSLTHGRTPAFPLIFSSLATKQHLKNAPPHHHTPLQQRADTVTPLLQPEATSISRHSSTTTTTDDDDDDPGHRHHHHDGFPDPTTSTPANERTNEPTNERTNERTSTTLRSTEVDDVKTTSAQLSAILLFVWLVRDAYLPRVRTLSRVISKRASSELYGQAMSELCCCVVVLCCCCVVL